MNFSKLYGLTMPKYRPVPLGTICIYRFADDEVPSGPIVSCKIVEGGHYHYELMCSKTGLKYPSIDHDELIRV